MADVELLTTDVRDRITDARADLAELQQAIATWRANGGRDKNIPIPFAYGRIRALLSTLRGILADLVDLDNDKLVDLVWRLRQGARATAALLVRPDRLIPTLQRAAGAFAAAGGRPELANLPHRKMRSYMVQEGDTPQSIMQRFTNDADRWLELVILNDLDHPYITDDDTFVRKHFAVGTATFTHPTAIPTAYTVPIGTVIETLTGSPVQFVTTEEGVIPASELSATVAIEALEAGEGGNVAPQAARVVRGDGSYVNYSYTLTASVQDVACNPGSNTIHFTHTSRPRVAIATQTCGGRILNVKFPGETLYVPVAQGVAGGTPAIIQRPSADPRVALFGSDYWMGEDGTLARDATGDVRMARGLENLAIALRNRIMTRKGDLTLHPAYGSEIHDLIGEYTAAPIPDEIELLIRIATQADPRVRETTVQVTGIDSSAVKVLVNWETEPTRDTGLTTLVVDDRRLLPA